MQGIEKPEVINTNRQLTVGPIPGRKGSYLGLVENNHFTPLAKFTSDLKAKRFLRLLAELQVPTEAEE